MLGLTYFFGSLALLIGGYAVYDTVVHPILKSSDAILVRACGNSWWLFHTIACGAISGFHATQSPLMARCMRNEKNGPCFS